MKAKKIYVLLCSLVACLLLYSCGDSENKKIFGEWKYESIGGVPAETTIYAHDTFVFEAFGVVKMTKRGETTRQASWGWNVRKEELLLSFSRYDDVICYNFRIIGNKMYFDMNGSKGKQSFVLRKIK